jgi:K+-transporting ATPase KdpF subunit
MRAVAIRRTPAMLANILLIVVAVLLLGYLLLALLKPEKF